MMSDNQDSAQKIENAADTSIGFEGRRAAFLTKHEKVPLISQSLLRVGIDVMLTEEFDTDELGTFSGDVARKLTPLECARFKAQKACEVTGLDMGIGSEGSFGGGPMPGFVNWDEEFLVLYDKKHNLEVVAFVQGPIKVSDLKVSSLAKIEYLIKQFGQQQIWTLKTSSNLYKGIRSFAEVVQYLKTYGIAEDNHLKQQDVRLEPDYRAMHCPERQEYIRQAAEQLRARLMSLCPKCQTPDFWRTDIVKGAPCMGCHLPTEHPKAYVLSCKTCQYENQEPSDKEFIDPAQCQFCNP